MKELFSVHLRPKGQLFFAYTLNNGFVGDFKDLTIFVCGWSKVNFGKENIYASGIQTSIAK